MKETNNKAPQKFWKLLDKIAPNSSKSISTNNIKMSNRFSHFKSILNTKDKIDIPSINDGVGPLDFQFIMEELAAATVILKAGKCPGLDNIINEMILCTFNSYPCIILSLFNKIFATGCPIPSWYIAIITPIFKKGSPNDPENYRGISFLSCLAKFFYTVINNRLTIYCNDKNILSPSQLGFIPGNRTTDAHIILHNLICKYCHYGGKKLYACFIDFSKAFDTVPRDILFKKLISYGITGKFLKTMSYLYSNDKACINSGGRRSGKFGINQRVRRGCVLRPLLFNIFIADLPLKLNAERNIVIHDAQYTNCLLWADDVVLSSDNEEDLKSLLQHLHEYCTKSKLTINHDKSKCMIFNKTGRLIRTPFFLGGKRLENVRS